jgi:hypothetical protein
MIFAFSTLLAALLTAPAPSPLESVWIRSPHAGSPAMEKIMPEVHSVTVEERSVTVRSAGISMLYLGPLQSSPNPQQAPQEYAIRLPRYPRAATAHPASPSDITGIFVNGVPIHNQSPVSYQGRNLWHFDAQFADRVPAEELHSLAPGLLEQLVRDHSRPAAIIGYALDGFPIYDASRMHSSYKLRKITERTGWGDGTKLTPAQYGPPVSEEYPLGTFAEDYEYSAGSGDLDEFNGRFLQTPEYPAGTYAYFLSSDDTGKLTFPYLTPGRYYGELPDRREPAQRLAIRPGLTLRSDSAQVSAGTPVLLSFRPTNRMLEYVHERPMHLMIVSADLAEFDHVHPELVGDDFQLSYTFRHGGHYRAYLDFTPPGSDTRIESFDFQVDGPRRASEKLKRDTAAAQQAGSLQVTLVSDGPIRAGRDTLLKFALRDTGTGEPPADLEPYLGAWAHFVLIGDGLSAFIHAHPLARVMDSAMPMSGPHVHCAMASGPAPGEVRTSVIFPKPGLYKLWTQLQRHGEVITVPFVLQVK